MNMNIDYEAKLLELKTIPEQDGKTDICKVVAWEIKFFDTTYSDEVCSLAQVDTKLDTDTLSDSFVEFSDLTQQRVLQMVLDHHGGNAFLDELLPYHEANLLKQFNEVGPDVIDITELPEN